MGTATGERHRSTVRERRAQEMKRQIVDATIEILARDGLRESTTAEVARRADVSERSIFWHFGSREGLMRAVALELIGRVSMAGEPALTDPTLSHREKILAVADRLVMIARTEPEALLAVNVLLNDNTLMERVRPELRTLIRERRKDLSQLIRDAVAAGEIKPISPTVFTEFVSGAMLGMHVQLRHHREGYDPEPMFEALRTSTLAILGLDEEGNRIG